MENILTLWNIHPYVAGSYPAQRTMFNFNNNISFYFNPILSHFILY